MIRAVHVLSPLIQAVWQQARLGCFPSHCSHKLCLGIVLVPAPCASRLIVFLLPGSSVCFKYVWKASLARDRVPPALHAGLYHI